MGQNSACHVGSFFCREGDCLKILLGYIETKKGKRIYVG